MLKDRVKEIMQAEHLNAKDFAEKLGIQRSSLSHIYSGRNKPSLDFIVKISKAFPDINMEWLLHGRGSMARNPLPEMDTEDVTYVTSPPKSAELPVSSTAKDEANKSARILEKIILIYSDGTFREMSPSPGF